MGPVPDPPAEVSCVFSRFRVNACKSPPPPRGALKPPASLGGRRFFVRLSCMGKEGDRVAKPEKVAMVEEIADGLRRGQGIVLTDYRGLNVKAMTELRTELRKVGVEFKVVKNTLTLRAAKQVEIEGLEPLLEGPTAIAIGYDDPVAVAKAVSAFAKTHEQLQIKGGILEGNVISVDQVKALANLPSREELIAQVLRGMQAPIAGLVNVLHGSMRNLVYVLEAIRKQKESAA